MNPLTERLPASAKLWLNVLVASIAIGLGAYFCMFFRRNLVKNWKRGAISESVAEVPLWIPDTIVFVGACWTCRVFVPLQVHV